jgi:hypothetical protein
MQCHHDVTSFQFSFKYVVIKSHNELLKILQSKISLSSFLLSKVLIVNKYSEFNNFCSNSTAEEKGSANIKINLSRKSYINVHAHAL